MCVVHIRMYGGMSLLVLSPCTICSINIANYFCRDNWINIGLMSIYAFLYISVLVSVNLLNTDNLTLLHLNKLFAV